MSTLMEIEAAAAALPQEQQRSLLEWLSERVGDPAPTPSLSHSVLDIAPVSLGGIIDLVGSDDDVLGEMLEGLGTKADFGHVGRRDLSRRGDSLFAHDKPKGFRDTGRIPMRHAVTKAII